MKKRIAFLLSALMITQNAYAASTVNEPSYSDGILTVSGISDKANVPVKVEIFNKGVEYSTSGTVTADNISDIFMDIRQMNASDDGSFGFEIPVNTEPGNYLIRIGFFGGELVEKSYATYTAEDLDAAVSGFLADSEKDEQKLKQLVDDYYSGLGVNYSDLKSLSDEEASLAYENIIKEITADFTKDKLIQAINKEIAVRQISKNATVKLITSYAAVLGIEAELYYKDFLELSDEKKEELVEKCEGAVNADGICKSLKNAVILDDISDSLWNEIYSVLVRYNEYLNIDFTNLNKIPENSEQRKNIMSDLKTAVVNGVIDDISQISSKLDELIKKYPYSSGSSSGGSTGGGGGGKGSVNPGSKAPVSSTNAVYTGSTVQNQTAAEKPFNDLDDYSWAEEAIIKLYGMGAVNGKADKVFDPAGNVTREEFTAMLVRAVSLENKGGAISFSDVADTRWSYDYISAAAGNGIINGYENGEFAPEKNIIRQDMAVIAARAIQAFNASLTESEKTDFSDRDKIDDYAAESVMLLAGAGIINGKDGAFVPDGITSRAEAAVVIYRVTEFLK